MYICNTNRSILKSLYCFLIFFYGLLGYPQDSEIVVNNLDVNSEFPHFGIVPFGNNQIIFTTYQLKKNGKPKVAFSGEGVLSVYKGRILSDGNIDAIEELKIDPEASLGSITSAVLNSDGSRIYIMTTYTNKNMPKGSFNKANFHLEVGEFKEGIGYTNFKVLPFCKLKYSYAHPSLSADGRTLYFISNFRGGRQSTKGGSDIFSVEILEDGTFGAPKNLGSRINSYSREMFPVMSKNNTLYFSSNKSNGFGGFDIYKSKMNQDGTFAKAEKLPKPFNSADDDFSLVMLANGNSGYFVSKRDKGKGDDDIYYFTIEK